MRDWFSLIRNQPCDYFRACFEQQRGGLSGWLCNDSVFQLFFNGDMNGGGKKYQCS